MTNLCIDISHHNGLTPNAFHDMWAAGVRCVIHKATEAFGHDPTYKERAKRAATMPELCWGAYDFLHDMDGADQAKRFLDFVQPDAHTGLAMDWEYPLHNAPPMKLAQCERYAEVILKETKRRPLLYTFVGFLAEHPVPKSSILMTLPLWIARYNSFLGPTPKEWCFWQYTGDDQGPGPHRVAGVTGPCDRSYYWSDEKMLRQQWPFRV